jgi:dipeptidase E
MRLLLISSSVVHGYGYLDHSEPQIREHLGQLKTVAFIPFAAHDHAAYTAKVHQRFKAMGYYVLGYDQLESAEAVFVGGGNTFRLLKTLQDRDLLKPLAARVRAGLPYIGSSAGSILTSPTIRTTNDMPIVWPRSLDALGLISFQLNCHYLDPDLTSTHKGETREERLLEYHEENTTPVVGLREGCCIRVDDDASTLLGTKPARIFLRGKPAFEVDPGTRLDIVLRKAES